MNRKRILYGLTILIVVLTIGVALAIVPPPPANQELGIYDTVCRDFAEADCRECHDSGVPDRHHLLVQNESYVCKDCHHLGAGGGINSPIRDCVVCHDTSPHHNTTEAEARNCSHCHGSFVDDYNDGHYIPTYDPSLITPDTSFTVEAATGKKWGGCEACHEPNSTSVPPIYSNRDTHHNLGNVSLDCLMCHGDTSGMLSIRKCEECHGVKSLHNIQYDYPGTEGSLGYGHIGDNWDCAGCHIWYVAYSSYAPQEGPIVPSIAEESPGKIVAGVETVMTITGTNFVNTVNGINYTSDVVIDTGAETITLAPDLITDSEIVVTTPEMVEGTYGLYVVKNEMRSKRVPIVVAPQVTIDSATIRRAIVTIRGSGFGDKPDESYAEWLGVTVAHAGNDLETSIVNWDNTRVVVDCPSATVGDEVTVNALHGSDSATIG